MQIIGTDEFSRQMSMFQQQ